jgi:hypothetical protein
MNAAHRNHFPFYASCRIVEQGTCGGMANAETRSGTTVFLTRSVSSALEYEQESNNIFVDFQTETNGNCTCLAGKNFSAQTSDPQLFAGRSGQARMPGLGRGGRAQTPVDYRHGRENRCFYGITSKSNKGKKMPGSISMKRNLVSCSVKILILSRSSLHPKGHERCSWPLV